MYEDQIRNLKESFGLAVSMKRVKRISVKTDNSQLRKRVLVEKLLAAAFWSKNSGNENFHRLLHNNHSVSGAVLKFTPISYSSATVHELVSGAGSQRVDIHGVLRSNVLVMN